MPVSTIETEVDVFLPFFTTSTLSSEEIVKEIKKEKNKFIAILAIRAKKIKQSDIMEVVKMVPNYEVGVVAIEYGLEPEQQLQVIKAIESNRSVVVRRVIEFGCDAEQIFNMFKLFNDYYIVAPAAINSGKLTRNQKFEILEMTKNNLNYDHSSLCFNTIEAMLKDKKLEESDKIKAIKNLPPDYYPTYRISAAEILLKQDISIPSIFSILDICKGKRLDAVFLVIKKRILDSNDIMLVIRDYGNSDWGVIETAMENYSFSKNQISEICKSGKQFGLSRQDKEKRNSVLEKAYKNGVKLKDLRQSCWDKIRTLILG